MSATESIQYYNTENTKSLATLLVEVFKKDCSSLELVYLGLGAHQVVDRATDPAVEDFFCQQMRNIGQNRGQVWRTGWVFGLKNRIGQLRKLLSWILVGLKMCEIFRHKEYEFAKERTPQHFERLNEAETMDE